MVEYYVDPEGNLLPLFNHFEVTGVRFGVHRDHSLQPEGKGALVRNLENRIGHSNT